MSLERERDDTLTALGALLREGNDPLPDDPLLAPFSEAERKQVADAVMRRLYLAPPARAAGPELAGRPPRRRARVVGAALLAAAASLLLMLRPPDAALPRYSLEGPAPERVFRDHAAATRHGHTLGRSLELVLRPATRTEADVSVRAYVGRRGEPLAPFTPRIERLPGGGLLLRARTGKDGELAVAAGKYRLVFLLGADEHALGDPAEASSSDVQRLELELELHVGTSSAQ